METRGRKKLEGGDYCINRCFSVKGSLFMKVKQLSNENGTSISKIIADAFILYVADNEQDEKIL